MNDWAFWVICLIIFLFALSVVVNVPIDDSNAEPFDDMDKLSKKEIEALRKMARAYADGKLVVPNLRVTGELVIDGAAHCKQGLTAKEINSVRLSSNTVDGATVKGEDVKDNNGVLVKRGQRIRISNNGLYQVWTIEKDE